MSKIRKKLDKAGWLKEKDEIEKIAEFYDSSIATITAFTDKSNFHFKNVEADVHELRRKLRWLSIYPQSLRGSIQLSKGKTQPKYLAKYLTKEIITSPFNIMPDAGDAKYFLLLEKNYFYALSWMIATLGKLKDNGLRVIVIKEALQQTAVISDGAAFKKAYAFTGTGQPHIKQLLDDADALCKTYFQEKNLQRLLMGKAAVKP